MPRLTESAEHELFHAILAYGSETVRKAISTRESAMLAWIVDAERSALDGAGRVNFEVAARYTADGVPVALSLDCEPDGGA
jgi:hypothetical protein